MEMLPPDDKGFVFPVTKPPWEIQYTWGPHRKYVRTMPDGSTVGCLYSGCEEMRVRLGFWFNKRKYKTWEALEEAINKTIVQPST